MSRISRPVSRRCTPYMTKVERKGRTKAELDCARDGWLQPLRGLALTPLALVSMHAWGGHGDLHSMQIGREPELCCGNVRDLSGPNTPAAAALTDRGSYAASTDSDFRFDDEGATWSKVLRRGARRVG